MAFASPTSLLARPPASRPLRVAHSRAPLRAPLRVPLRNRRATFTCTTISSTMSSTSTSASTSESTPTESSDESNNKYRLSAAERARTLVHICKSATLCTSSQRHEGIPFGSHVDFVQTEGDGAPVFLLARNANHTGNLLQDPRCSLYCQPAAAAGQDGCRVTLVGVVSPLSSEHEDSEAMDEIRDAYIDTHVHAADALQYPEVFRFYRMEVEDVLFVAGYGVISQWVSASHFANALPDALAFDAPSIVARLNETKETDIRRLCTVFLDASDVERCTMTSLDCLGFDLRVKDAKGGTREFRVAFREQVANRFDAQSALVKAFQEAWERENGFDETWQTEDTRPTIVYSPSY